MFDSLREKLDGVFKSLRSKGRLTEDDVKEAMKEIKRALLAADVNFKVVKDFIKKVKLYLFYKIINSGCKICRDDRSGSLLSCLIPVSP